MNAFIRPRQIILTLTTLTLALLAGFTACSTENTSSSAEQAISAAQGFESNAKKTTSSANEVGKSAEEAQKIYTTYLARLTVLHGQCWSSPEELKHRWLWLFDAFYHEEHEQTLYSRYGDEVPIDDVLTLLNRYFDGVTKEMLIEEAGEHYHPDTNTIDHQEDSRSWAPFEVQVTDWTQQEDLLTIDYTHKDERAGSTNQQFTLTVRLMEDGSFRYLSNQINDHSFSPLLAQADTMTRQLVTWCFTLAQLSGTTTPDEAAINSFILTVPAVEDEDYAYKALVQQTALYEYPAASVEQIANEVFGKPDWVLEGGDVQFDAAREVYTSSLAFGMGSNLACTDITSALTKDQAQIQTTFTLTDGPIGESAQEYGQYTILYQIMQTDDHPFLRFVRCEKR